MPNKTTAVLAADSEDLRERRQALGLTRIDLALTADVSITHIATLEAGLVPRRSQALGRVVAALDAAEREQDR